MAIRYINQKCSTCPSTKFNPIPGTNMLECAYCGNRIEMREEADTLFTVKNVVRQVLIDVSFGRFGEAEKNLAECEKIDSRYVGTITARLCFLLAAVYGSCSSRDRRGMLTPLEKNYSLLRERGDKPCEEELILYEFLDSAEAVGTLILVYDTLGDSARLEAVYPLFRPEEVCSPSLGFRLLRLMLSREKYDIADRLVANYNNLELKPALLLLLEQYPDVEKKVENCSLLFSQNALSGDDRGAVEEYLRSTADSAETKYGIALAALSTSAAPGISCLMETVISKTEDKEKIEKLFGAILSRRLSDYEKNTILEYALGKCGSQAALCIVRLLLDSKQFIALSRSHLIAAAENRLIDPSSRRELTGLLLGFSAGEKTKEQFAAHYLLNTAEDNDVRLDYLGFLLGQIASLPAAAVEKYVLSCKADGENKPEVVGMIFSSGTNPAYCRGLLDKYAGSNTDSPEIKERLLDVLSDSGLTLSGEGLAAVLADPAISGEQRLRLLARAKNSGTDFPGALDRYLLSVEPQSFSGSVLSELVQMSDMISEGAFVRYLLALSGDEASKPVNAAKLESKCGKPAASLECGAVHLGNRLECTALQAYLLLSPDSPAVTCSTAEALGARSVRLNSHILVSGERKRFKKYLSSVRQSLSGSASAAAEYFGLL